MVSTRKFSQFVDVEALEPVGLALGANSIGPNQAEGSTTAVINAPTAGLMVRQWVRVNSSSIYVPALADNAQDGEVIGIIIQIIDANHFLLQQSGYISSSSALLSGLTPGSVYFLDTVNPGNMVLTDALINGQISRPVFVADTATSGWIVPYRGLIVGGASPSGGGAETAASSFANMITNSQFAVVNFDTSQTLNIAIAGAGTTTVPIAPFWDLVITTTGASTATVTRTSIAGNADLSTNPPYTLTLTPGANTTVFKLVQPLAHVTDIWSSTSPGVAAYAASSLSFGPQAGTITMSYEPSNGTPQTILTGVNPGGSFLTFENTQQLILGDNTDTSDTGFVNIVLNLPTNTPVTLSSVQVLGMNANILNVPYEQKPVNRQISDLASYYIPQLQLRGQVPINPAATLGLNPDQFATFATLFPTGNNTSFYAIDDVILFQSLTNGIIYEAFLKVTAQQNGVQFAIVQYLDRIGGGDGLSCEFFPITNKIGGITGKVTFWTTFDPLLPRINPGSNESLIASLDATGKPATFHGNWTEIPRPGLGDASFNVPAGQIVDLAGWFATAPQIAGFTGAAMVIGFEPMNIGEFVNMIYIAGYTGQSPGRPNDQSINEVYLNLETFYESSYPRGAIGGAITTSGAKSALMGQTIPTGGGNNIQLRLMPFSIDFHNRQSRDPAYGESILTLYSPITGAANMVRLIIQQGGVNVIDQDIAQSLWTESPLVYESTGVIFTPVTTISAINFNSSSATETCTAYIIFHYTIDARTAMYNP